MKDFQEDSHETSDEDTTSEETQLIKVNGILRSSSSDDLDGKDSTHQNGSVVISIPSDEPSVHRYPIKDKSQKRKPYPHEWSKFIVALVFVFVNFFATTVSLAIVHEYYPIIPPLPDHILDSLPYQAWPLKVCEVMLQVQSTIAAVVVIFHPHRFIVLRRLCVILGLLYGYRAITMFVTVLPRSDSTYFCAPKLAEEGKTLTFFVIIERAFSILSGFGLTINGKHTFCGDYIFSGHTSMFVVTYLLVQEYTSRRFFLLHWALFLSCFIGIGFLLWCRGHYTIDCLIAYYVATRLWYIYHSMANHSDLKKATSVNHFTRIWWWSLFRWFEENVKSGPLPNGFSLPISRKLCKCLRSKSRELVSETSRLTRLKKSKQSA